MDNYISLYNNIRLMHFNLAWSTNMSEFCYLFLFHCKSELEGSYMSEVR